MMIIHLFFIKNSNSIVVVLVHVADIIVTNDNVYKIEELITYSTKKFEIKDLGVLQYFTRLKLQNQNEVFVYRNASMSLTYLNGWVWVIVGLQILSLIKM